MPATCILPILGNIHAKNAKFKCLLQSSVLRAWTGLIERLLDFKEEPMCISEYTYYANLA